MELELVYNEETQEWEQKHEPFITIECETEEDFEFIGTAVAFYKKHLEEQEKPQTNADRIRAMTDEELAAFHANGGVTEACLRLEDEGYSATTEQKMELREKLYATWLKWLQQPAEEADYV